jgi:ABC-2 type transport system permease protein
MSSPTGVIHDIGYQRYTGPRLGRAYAARSLYTHSLRTAYGLGRSAWSKVAPWGIFAILVAVAAVLAAVRSQIGEKLTEPWEYPGNIVLLVVLFSAAVAPELVSRDLRSGVLALYFSRPLSRMDYPVAKWAAQVSATFLLLATPLFLLFLAGAFTVSGMSAVWDEAIDFGKGLVSATIMAVLFASVAMAVASFARNRAIAAAIIVGVFLLSGAFALVLSAVAYESAQWTENGPVFDEGAERLLQLSGLASPTTMSGGISGWLFDPTGNTVGPYGPLYLGAVLLVVVTCVLLTMARYRKVAR